MNKITLLTEIPRYVISHLEVDESDCLTRHVELGIGYFPDNSFRCISKKESIDSFFLIP